MITEAQNSLLINPLEVKHHVQQLLSVGTWKECGFSEMKEHRILMKDHRITRDLFIHTYLESCSITAAHVSASIITTEREQKS